MHEADRGLFDLRRGRPLHVTSGLGFAPDGAVLLATVEGLTHQTLEQLRDVDGGPLRLAVTQYRAHAMGLVAAAPAGHVPDRSTSLHTGDVSLGLNGETSPDQIWRLSSGMGRSTTGMLDLRAASASEIGGLTLARLGQLLPIASDSLGTLVNRVDHSDSIPPWTFGAQALLQNLAARRLL